MKANFRLAMIIETFSLAIHVADESLNDFLSLYNPLVRSLNNNLGINFFPVFTFTEWIAGLILAIISLFILSYFSYKEKKWMLYFGFFYGIFMIFNALGHITGSIYYSSIVAGTYSAPFLLAASIYLIWSANQALKAER